LIQRQLRAGQLSLGDRTVCIKIVDKRQTPTGTHRYIKVTAANPSMRTY